MEHTERGSRLPSHCRATGNAGMTATAETIRVLIADDHQLFREGLAALIGSAPELEIVGQAATGG